MQVLRHYGAENAWIGRSSESNQPSLSKAALPAISIHTTYQSDQCLYYHFYFLRMAIM